MDVVKNVSDMTDRELLEELVTGLRDVRAKVEGATAVLSQASSHPLLGRLFGAF